MDAQLFANLGIIVKRIYPEIDEIPLSGNPDSPFNWRHPIFAEPTPQALEAEFAIWQSECQAEQAILQAQEMAKTNAAAIPNWATWTQADFQTWYNANISPTQINAITSLAEAKPILLKQSAAIEALAKMVIAIRNQLWPDLQG